MASLHSEFAAKRYERGSGARTLARLGWRYLLHHGGQSLLLILGIALGVAVVVSVDLANESAFRAFEYGTAAIAGRATHQITGGPLGIDESTYVSLRREGLIQLAAPVVSDVVSAQDFGGRAMQLLGVDPFVDQPFRAYSQGVGSSEVQELVQLLTRPGAVLVSASLANDHSIEVGDQITLLSKGNRREVSVVGFLQPADSFTRRAIEGLILADLSTAQELSGRMGYIDRIDLILESPVEARFEDLRRSLPADLVLSTAESRAGTVEEMTRAFRVNLTALSLLALVVGVLLIYNTMTFSVVKRRELFGALRALGVTRREVFGMVLSEAFLLAIIGSGAGLLLGLLLSRVTIQLVSRTISDVYFALTVREVALPASSLVKGAAMGIAVSLTTAAAPAWEAASVPPTNALQRSVLESKARRATIWGAIAGLVLFGAAALLLLWPSTSVTVAFLGTAAAVLGFAALTPIVLRGVLAGIGPLLRRLIGALGRLAPRGAVNSMSRTSIATAALMIAVAVSIGVSIMIGSFRHTIDLWMTQALQGDIYIQVPSFTATRSSTAPLLPRVITEVRKLPQVVRVDPLRAAVVESSAGPLDLFAVDNRDFGDRPYLTSQVPTSQIWTAMLDGGITVSEALARRIGMSLRGSSLSLLTASGWREFEVVAIYYDYVSAVGTVAMSLDTYQEHWQDNAVTALSLYVDPYHDVEQVAAELRSVLAESQVVEVRANRVLREDVFAVFDRTFAVTSALQVITTAVAFIGVLSALLSVQIDRSKELGILRSIGLTARQLWSLVLLETGLLGAVAGLSAIPTGFVLALVLIYVINRRTFGWTLLLQVHSGPFLTSLAVAVVAALLAAVYPAFRSSRMVISESLRSE